MKKRVLSFLLAFVMVIGLLPATALAAAEDNAIKLELVKDTTTFSGKEVLRMDFYAKSGTDTPTNHMVFLKYDASKLYPAAQGNGADASSVATNFAADKASTFTKNNFAKDDGFGGTETSEVKFYTVIQGGYGYICWKVTEPADTPAFADFTRISSIFFGLKEGVTFDAIPSDVIGYSDPAVDGSITSASAAAEINVNGGGSGNVFKYKDKNSTDTMTVAPTIAAGTGVTFAKPDYTGTAATITSVAKSGSNVVVTATIPSGETGEYGYSATNSAASVTNWQSSNSFATPEPGTYYFFARVAENSEHKAGGESECKPYTVNGPLSLSYTAPASMTVDTAISEMAPTVSGGSGSGYTYAVTAGILPTGLSLNTATGVISGTPTAVAAATDVTITVTDSDSDTQTHIIHFPAVAKKANTMTSVTQADVEYGTEVNPSVNACNGTTPTYQYKVRGADDGTYTSTKPTTVGEYTVKASSTGHATVADAVVTTDFAITQKSLNNLGFTGVTVTKVYDGTTSAGAVGGSAITFDGKEGSDEVSIKAVAGEYTDANAGTGKTVTLTLSLDGEAKDNYKLAIYTQSFDAAAITVADYTYTVAATQTFRTGSGLSAITVAPATGTGVNSESVTGTLGWYTDNGYSTPATDAALSSLAADASVTLYWKFTATDTNYTTTSKTGSTVFTAKNKDDLSTSIDVSGITGLSKTYDGAAASYTGSATVTGHTGLDSSLVYEWYKADNTKLTGAPKDVGSYYLKVSIPDTNADYMGSAKVDFTIAKKVVTVEAGTYEVSKTYDGTTNAGTASGTLNVTGILPADSGVTVQATPVAYGSNGVGAQSSMDVQIALNGTGSENYKIKDDATTVTVPCEITARPITIAGATATNRDYEAGNVSVETDVTFTGTIGTLTKGSDYTVTGTMDNANAGSGKTVNVTVTLTNDNYSLAANTTTTTVTINKIAYASSTTATGSAKYGTTGSVDLRGYLAEGGSFGTVSKTDTESVLSGDPVMDGDSLKFTFVNDAGKATKTAIIKVPVNNATNYNNYEITVEVTVNDKTVPTVTAPVAKTNLTYDGTAQALISAGATNGGEMQYSLTSGSGYSTAIPTATNANTYTVYYKVVGDSEYADVAESSVSVTIAKKDVTVAPKSFTITKGNAIPTFALEYTGLVGSDTLTPSVTPAFTCYETGTTPVSTSTAAGTYTITWTNEGATTFTGADNYNVAKTATGTLTINNPAPSGGGGGVTTYSITADSAQNGTVTVSPKSASKGTTVTVTVKPDEGYTLETLTVTDKDGKAVTVTEKDGKYTFTMPASKVTVKAAFVEIEKPVVNPFVDVKEGDYFYDAVLWAVEKGITDGTSATTFSPDAGCTRAQIVTFLWRAAGSPAPESSSNPFTDVEAGSYYYDAVLWAVEQGITKGTSATAFSPDTVCTRSQTVTLLYRAAGSPRTVGGTPFTDVSDSAYYDSAVQWAVEHGVTAGTGANTFSPDATCTRAQIVTFLYRNAT